MASGFLSATVYPATHTHTHTKGDADGGLTVHLEARIVVARVAVALTLAVHACIRQHTSGALSLGEDVWRELRGTVLANAYSSTDETHALKEVASYQSKRPSATSVRGLKLLVQTKHMRLKRQSAIWRRMQRGSVPI
jgi:hypothetical protein